MDKKVTNKEVQDQKALDKKDLQFKLMLARIEAGGEYLLALNKYWIK